LQPEPVNLDFSVKRFCTTRAIAGIRRRSLWVSLAFTAVAGLVVLTASGAPPLKVAMGQLVSDWHSAQLLDPAEAFAAPLAAAAFRAEVFQDLRRA
jgi:uncharacterized protein involved in exopolysaccharide biosynthesis